MALEPLIRQLADGQVHTGDALGAALGVSRAAVWKQLRKARDWGLAVEPVRGQGYQLPGGLELLDAAAIEAALPDPVRAMLPALSVHWSLPSTSDYLLQAARAGEIGGHVCLAERQTAGRGRRGRAWQAPFGRQLLLSLGWQVNEGAAALAGLSLAVAVAVSEALADLALPAPQLKWPNDVLFDGGKLGGILLELQGDAAGPCQLVVGLGLNVSPLGLDAVDQPWRDLSSAAGRPVSRNRLAAAVLSRVVPLLAEYPAQGFAPWRERWAALDALAGRPVRVEAGQHSCQGVANGVTEQGALRVMTDAGERIFHGGEVSVRLQS